MPVSICADNPRLLRPQRQEAGSTAIDRLSGVREPRHLARTRLVRVVLAFAAVYLIWGSTFLGIRIAIQTIPPGIMAGMRWGIAGALLYAVLRWRGASPPSARDWRTAALIGGGIIFGGNGTVTYAERFIPSGTVAVIVAVVPAMMALLGWLSGITTRPRLPVWLGIALATWGVVVIARPGGVTFGREQTVSIAILMIGELLWAAASLYAVRVHQQASGFLMAAMQMLCGGAFMLGTAALRGEFNQFDIRAVTASSVLALTYLMLIGSIIGFSAYLWLLRNVEATRVATYAYVNPIVAVFLGWLVLGEKLAPALLAGSALVVIGIALIVTFRSRPSQTSTALPNRL
jgi:drug/metabolite transporter (DMT)-like permease